MEPQVEIYCRKCKKTKCCVDLIIYFLSIILTFVLGLLIGGLTSIVGLLTIGALIVLLITLVILITIRIITLLCCQRKC